MNAKKIVTAGLALVMVAGISVAGTLAYLTSTTGEVKNTFTVGKVAITLDEAKVTADGAVVPDAARVTENEYKLMPGHSYIKDPTVHVDATSEDAWLFVKVENGIAAIEDSSNTIAAQMADNGWTAVSGAGNVYAYESIVHAGEDYEVFGTFVVSGDVEGQEPDDPAEGVLYLSDYANAEINVTAYAIQADGFSSANAAWTAFAEQELA